MQNVPHISMTILPPESSVLDEISFASTDDLWFDNRSLVPIYKAEPKIVWANAKLEQNTWKAKTCGGGKEKGTTDMWEPSFGGMRRLIALQENPLNVLFRPS
ncbi:BgTH12-00461 [Blumeria graminis f. sp. triticale]|uniref:BgtAc-30499 n=3 Tax=Blumeria graminis TaxID=34373 RepID=A0A9X9MLS4_BLUGR|nr:hypothetical protein BGT96224_Ac30499 [Blumeria graminis f. sp. tritici 96224]CAD6504962.1 BgTH12-00461 [Blumeria graminis f. sp. triticale]VDB92981.1 BgtAc-30499 [Blumeria graminis f. sp. tritici]